MSRSNTKLKYTLIKLAVVPCAILGFLFAIIGITTLDSAHESEVFSTLNGVCTQVREEFIKKYPANYYMDAKGRFYCDGTDISDDTQILDDFGTNFGAEVTIFFGETRVMTTITNAEGYRIVGTKQTDERVLSAVYDGDIFSSSSIMINGEHYYGVYMPLYDHDTVCGMVFAGLSNREFQRTLRSFYYQMIALMIFIVIIMAVYALGFASQIAQALGKVREYLGNFVINQSMDEQLSEEVLARKDEIGDLGRYAVEAGNQLKTIIGRDALTGLYNRRMGSSYLNKLYEKAISGDEFTLAMCDVDFFKAINDTYGHDMGDQVLMTISRLFKNICGEDAVAIRWGGEEFILGFELNMEDSLTLINRLTERVKSESFISGDSIFHITMTFGVTTFSKDKTVEEMISDADAKLYRGKEGGRNLIIS